jgi:hypothetical protein
MMRSARMVAAALALGLAGCTSLGAGDGFGSSYYSLVRVRPAHVGDGSMVVTPPEQWNRARRFFFDDVRWVEDWTLNGPLLDGISFVTGLPDNKTLVRQSRRDEQQVPYFRSNMLAPEIAAMLESAFRVRGGSVDFRTISLVPRPFMGANGFQLDFEHLDGDELWRKGRAVGAVIDGRLYLILYDAARSHYYAAALPDFEAIVTSARRS